LNRVRASPIRIKQGIYGFAALLLAGLALLKWLEIDAQLFKILAISTGLLVAVLLMTYRAFAGVAEAARNAPQPPLSPDDDEDEDMK
jgi:urea transporter